MNNQELSKKRKKTVGKRSLWRFIVEKDEVRYGDKSRQKLTINGCNEPYKGKYWCPKLRWFRREVCPFLCRRECENYEIMCGCL